MQYGQFCPIAKAAEVVAERWSIIIIREVLAGSNTFNALKRGIPLISPTLLSRRLVELEDAGLINKVETGMGKPKFAYEPTASARELGPILLALGDWGNKWIGPDLEKKDYDPRLLMWDVSRNVDFGELEEFEHYTVQFDFFGVNRSLSRWWLVINNGDADVCLKNPGHDVSLTVESHIKDLTEVWMGHLDLRKARKAGRIELSGLPKDVRRFPKWFKLNPFAHR